MATLMAMWGFLERGCGKRVILPAMREGFSGTGVFRFPAVRAGGADPAEGA
jgi:hypothetical protein